MKKQLKDGSKDLKNLEEGLNYTPYGKIFNNIDKYKGKPIIGMTTSYGNIHTGGQMYRFGGIAPENKPKMIRFRKKHRRIKKLRK